MPLSRLPKGRYAAEMIGIDDAYPNWDWSTPKEAVLESFLTLRGYRTTRWTKRYTMWHFDATAPDASRLSVRVRPCGQWSGAAWDGAAGFGIGAVRPDEHPRDMLQRYVRAHSARGVSHELAVHAYGPVVLHAGLYPLTDLPAIWERQRDVLATEWQAGRTGRKKSTVQNGSIPSIWLKDHSSPGAEAMVRAFWSWPTVVSLQPTWPLEAEFESDQVSAIDDTMDDLGGPLLRGEVGADGQPRYLGVRSHVRRDPEVRRRVVERAVGGCEACDDARTYPGFLDVHHVFGVDVSDREWTCVALCPSCHRAAHWAPDAERVNARLAQIARRNFKASSGRSEPSGPQGDTTR